MTVARFRMLISLLALLAASPLWGAEEASRWPRNADELQVSLSVMYALEDGPFVCKVNLKNVSKRTLDYAVGYRWHEAECLVAADWKTKKEPLIRIRGYSGPTPPFTLRLAPGASASPTFYLHRSFLGVPAGDVPIRFGWEIYRTKKNPEKEADSKERLWRPEVRDLLFSLKRTQSVKVLPATKENVARVLRALKAEFARIALQCEGRNDYHSSSGDPARDLIQTLGSCRHKEFVPLLLRAMDCLPGSYYRGELVSTIYDSFPTPEEGFNALAAYLDSPQAASAVEVFDYWKREKENHEESKRRQVKLRNKPTADPASKEISIEELKWIELQSEEEAWRTRQRHLDTRLTKEQFDRLRVMKNVWTRALLYASFPERCPADWVAALRTDLGRITRPPERMHKLIAQLDDERFEVRERATRELIEWRDAFAVYLVSLPKDKLSLEASRRLREVLRGVSQTVLPPLPRRVLSHLAWSNQAEAGQLLDILRKAEPPNLITREAQDAFEQRQNHEKKMERLREGK